MLYEYLRILAADKTQPVHMVNGNKKKFLEDLEKQAKIVTDIVRTDCTKAPYTPKQYYKFIYDRLPGSSNDETFEEEFTAFRQKGEKVFTKEEIAQRKIIHNAATEAVVNYSKQDYIYTKAYEEAKGDLHLDRETECMLKMAETPEEMMTIIGYIKQDPQAINPETGNTYSQDIAAFFTDRLQKAKEVAITLSSVDDTMQMIDLFPKYARFMNAFTEMGGQSMSELENSLHFKFPEIVIKEWDDTFKTLATDVSNFVPLIYAEANPLFPEMDIKDANEVQDIIRGNTGRATTSEKKKFFYASAGHQGEIPPPKGYYSNPFDGISKAGSMLAMYGIGKKYDEIQFSGWKKMRKDVTKASLQFFARRYNKNWTLEDFTYSADDLSKMENCQIKDHEGKTLPLVVATEKMIEGKRLFLFDPKGNLLTELKSDPTFMIGFVQSSAEKDVFKFKEMAEKNEKTAVEKADKKFNAKMEKEINKALKKLNTPGERKAAERRIRAEYTKKHDALVTSELNKASDKELKANLKEMYKSFSKLQSNRTGDPNNALYNTLTNKLKDAMNCSFSNKAELVDKLKVVRDYAKDYLTSHIPSDVPKGSNLESRLKNASTALDSFRLIREKVNDYTDISSKYLPKEERENYLQQQAMERQNFVQGMERDLNANEIQINNQLDPNEISTSRNLVINPPIADNEDGRQTEQEVPQINEPGDRFEL